MSHWNVEKYVLKAPELGDLAVVIKDGLRQNFHDVVVEVTTCPDLRISPFSLAAQGLSGNERIADIGGPQNMRPLPKLDRKYSLREMMNLIEMDDGLIIGAGAGPFHHVGVNSELMPNLSYKNGAVNNQTRYAKIVDGGTHSCQKLPTSTDCAIMANLYGCDGERGDVIKIVAKKRTGRLNFTDSIQQALRSAYSHPVSIGGVFVITKGKAKLHVMPDFSKEPRPIGLKSEWLKFFDMSAPLTCLSVLHSRDPGLDLRLEHTHCFSEHNEGGHYHFDTTPDEVEYEAYFNIAKRIYRIDRPSDHHRGV